MPVRPRALLKKGHELARETDATVRRGDGDGRDVAVVLWVRLGRLVFADG